MIAALPMYDRPEVAGANDRLWHLIREDLGHGPLQLTRDIPAETLWSDPNLLLAQTCGLPYRAELHGRVRLVGTPDYGLPGAPPGHYYSVWVSRNDGPPALEALSGASFAYNGPMSQSGWAAPVAQAVKLGLRFGRLVVSGSHRASAALVADGKADVAALDAQSWRLIRRHDSFARKLRVIGQTEPGPGLPLITAPKNDPVRIFDAVARAIRRLSIADRAALYLRGVVRIPAEAYLALPTPAGPEHWLA